MTIEDIIDDSQSVDVDEAEPVEVDAFAGEAAKYGWKPAEEWAGDGHMSAEKFMTRGPGTSRKLQDELDSMSRDLEATKTSVARTEKALNAAAEARIQEAETKIRAEMRDAVESGDTDRYDALEKKRDDLGKDDDNTGKQQPLPEADVAAVQSWVGDNPMFNSDPVFKSVASALWAKAEAEGKTSVPDILAYIDKNVRLELPQKFQATAKPRKAAAVEAGGSAPRKQRGKSWSDIPAGDRAQAEEFISDGTFDALAEKNKMTAREAYAAQYWEQE